jgi:hypothetical protein
MARRAGIWVRDPIVPIALRLLSQSEKSARKKGESQGISPCILNINYNELYQGYGRPFSPWATSPSYSAGRHSLSSKPEQLPGPRARISKAGIKGENQCHHRCLLG